MGNTADRADLENRAVEVLQNQTVPLAELRDLAIRLKAQRSFGYARRLFARARLAGDLASQSDIALTLAQEEALCTYQDPDQPANARYDRALEILASVDDLTTTTNQ